MASVMRRILAFFTFTILMLSWPLAANAATVTVTSIADDNSAGTLRQVIASANAGDTITFDPTVFKRFQEIFLTGGTINLPQNLTITGPAARVGLLPNFTGSIFTVGATVSLANVDLVDGGTKDSGSGGAVTVSGTGVLTLTNCTVSNCIAPNGGAIFVSPLGSVTLDKCAVEFNMTDSGSGGAIYVANGGTLNLVNDTFYQNFADLNGGAIFDTLGAILNITNCTFVGNGGTDDGAIYSDGAHITIANSLLAFDRATTPGANEIVSTSTNPNFPATISVTTSDIYTPGAGSQFGALDFDPQFLTFGNYASLVDTLPLAIGSPAYGAGTAALAPPTDARGFTRPNPPSLGAFDLPFAQALPPLISPLGGLSSTPFTVSFSGPYTGSIIYVTTDGSQPTTSSPVYNGPFLTVGSGTETIQAIATAPGYAPSQITTGTFTITPAAPAYSAGLQLFSSPLDYPGATLDGLFGHPGVMLAVWAPSISQYDLTPNGAAGSVRLGVGYWGRLQQNVTFTSIGIAAPTNVPFKINLKKGWNQVGCPFTVSVPIASLTFGPNNLTFAQATSGSSPMIGSTVYSYSATANNNAGGYIAATALDPEVGYWIFAYSDTTMQVPAQ